jgi:hypothetical protein
MWLNSDYWGECQGKQDLTGALSQSAMVSNNFTSLTTGIKECCNTGILDPLVASLLPLCQQSIIPLLYSYRMEPAALKATYFQSVLDIPGDK